MTSPGTILVVDDDLLNRILLSTNLREDGYTVALAEDGRQALEMLGAQPYDVVLLDLLMPEMDGYQVLAQMKANSSWRNIPVIIVSSLDEMESILRCIEMGATDYLPKPFDPALLHARINALARQQAVARHRAGIHRTGGACDPGGGGCRGRRVCAGELGPGGPTRRFAGAVGPRHRKMARQVYTREQSLRQQVQELQIEIDEVKKARQVAEITETEHIRDLCARAQ